MTEFSHVFSRVLPEEYDEVAILARLTAEAMISRLALVTLQPKVILDLGCGTGYGSQLLKQCYPAARIVSVDAELSMLHYLQKKIKSDSQPIAAFAEHVPLKMHAVDLIFANLVLPWCTHWDSVIREWRRLLRPDGLLMFTCFGPDTLKEIEGELCIQRQDMHELGDKIVQARFSDPVMDTERLTLTYRDPSQLERELQQNGIVEKSWKVNDSVLTTTYEIIYGHAWGPSMMADQIADEQGVVKISLDALRGRRQS